MMGQESLVRICPEPSNHPCHSGFSSASFRPKSSRPCLERPPRDQQDDSSCGPWPCWCAEPEMMAIRRRLRKIAAMCRIPGSWWRHNLKVRGRWWKVRKVLSSTEVVKKGRCWREKGCGKCDRTGLKFSPWILDGTAGTAKFSYRCSLKINWGVVGIYPNSFRYNQHSSTIPWEERDCHPNQPVLFGGKLWSSSRAGQRLVTLSWQGYYLGWSYTPDFSWCVHKIGQFNYVNDLLQIHNVAKPIIFHLFLGWKPRNYHRYFWLHQGNRVLCHTTSQGRPFQESS